jgi:hypothetical protein
MWDTFRPLQLTPLWQANDRPEYAYSWNPDHDTGASDGRRSGELESVVTGPSE